jgi:hypothetical protein
LQLKHHSPLLLCYLLSAITYHAHCSAHYNPPKQALVPVGELLLDARFGRFSLKRLLNGRFTSHGGIRNETAV